MDAGGFAALAAQFTDRAVITYDPRGVMRSPRDTPGLSTPDLHADDLHRLIDTLDAGPVDLFGSSGGAVNGLALIAKHPEHVRTLIAHEPPACPLLPDFAVIKAVVDDIDDSTDTKYTGWPERLYLIDRDGRVAYKSQPGPFGFKPAELEACRPSGDWPTVLATQWNILVLGPAGCCARPLVRFQATASISSLLHEG